MSTMAKHIPVVETERLILRAPTLDDLPAVTAFYASKHSQIIGGLLDARSVYRAMLSTTGSWALRGHGFWHIAEKQTDEYFGAVGILFSPGWNEPELGWNVVEAAEGKGIAFEAASAARHYAAKRLGLDGVISYIDPANIRSIALATRLGATYERDGTLLGHDVHIYRHPKQEAA